MVHAHPLCTLHFYWLLRRFADASWPISHVTYSNLQCMQQLENASFLSPRCMQRFMPKSECATYTEVLSAQTILLAGASYSFRNQELAVVGGGDTAVEEAIYLTKYGTMVSLQSGLTRLCSILEASCLSYAAVRLCLYSRAGWIRSDTSGTRANLIMNLVLIQRCPFKHFVYNFTSACRQAT